MKEATMQKLLEEFRKLDLDEQKELIRLLKLLMQTTPKQLELLFIDLLKESLHETPTGESKKE